MYLYEFFQARDVLTTRSIRVSNLQNKRKHSSFWRIYNILGVWKLPSFVSVNSILTTFLSPAYFQINRFSFTFRYFQTQTNKVPEKQAPILRNNQMFCIFRVLEIDFKSFLITHLQSANINIWIKRHKINERYKLLKLLVRRCSAEIRNSLCRLPFKVSISICAFSSDALTKSRPDAHANIIFKCLFCYLILWFLRFSSIEILCVISFHVWIATCFWSAVRIHKAIRRCFQVFVLFCGDSHFSSSFTDRPRAFLGLKSKMNTEH